MIVTVEVLINSNLEKVWNNWSSVEAVKIWNHASDDWYCPKATNEFKEGGRFCYTMSSVDNNQSFDFIGIYTKIVNHKTIETLLDDGRKVSVVFESKDNDHTVVTESFETENVNSADLQKKGWQAILDNFKLYCES